MRFDKFTGIDHLVSPKPTSVTVLLNHGEKMTLAGTGFTYKTVAGEKVLSGGVIKSIKGFLPTGKLDFSVTGTALAAATFVKTVEAGDTAAAFFKAPLKGNDTLTGSKSADNYDILYAYNGDVALDLSLVARGKRKDKTDWAGKTFTLELKHYPGRPHQWLVAAWVPKGIGGGGSLSPNRRSGPPPPPTKAPVSPKLLFLPVVFLGVLLAVLAAWAVRSLLRGRRASRSYAESLGYKSS
jgi:hypothetical protein